MRLAISAIGGLRNRRTNTTSAVKLSSINIPNITPLPGQHVNGELTQGENIADIGGIKLAYAALQKALDKNPEDRNKKIDGLTPEQRFFLSFAAIWRSKIRDEDQKLRLTTDPHSPAQFRVNGPLANMPEFQKAFNIPDGSAMVRPADKRVNIW